MAQQLTAEEQEVLAVFQSFLKGMQERRPASLLEMVLPDGMMTRVSNGEVRQLTIAALLDIFPKDGTSVLEERIYDPVVRTEGDIAVIWCAYDFRVDGEVRHNGTNIVSLARVDGRWRISGLSDTARYPSAPAA
jgi:hypothetical protein